MNLYATLETRSSSKRALAWLTTLSLAAGLLVTCGCTLAHAKSLPNWTNQQIVNAIYLAEGGNLAKYPYGIRSVRCATNAQCYKVCLRTVENNRLRYRKYGFKKYKNFISFLATRYCPVGSRTATPAEVRLNKFWEGNVLWALRKT